MYSLLTILQNLLTKSESIITSLQNINELVFLLVILTQRHIRKNSELHLNNQIDLQTLLRLIFLF